MKKEKVSAFDIFNVTFFVLMALICIFPFYYIFINSISANDLVAKGAIRFIPRGIHFNNYLQVFKIHGLFPAFLVSVARTLIGTFFSVLSASFLGYALSKQEFWGRKFWYRYVIITMYLSAGIIPAFINIKNLGLLNNFWVYVVDVQKRVVTDTSDFKTLLSYNKCIRNVGFRTFPMHL